MSVAEAFSPEQAAPVLVAARTRAFELARDIANLLGQAGGSGEILAAINATILGRVAGGTLETLDQVEHAAFRLLAMEYARVERAVPPSANPAVRAYALVVDAHDLSMLESVIRQGRAAEEAPLAAPDSPVVRRFLDVVAEQGLSRLPELLRGLGYRRAAEVVEASPEAPLSLALDVELLSSFYEALEMLKGTPAEHVLCGRLDIYALRAAAGAAPLARSNPALAEAVARRLKACMLDEERLRGVLGEEDYYSALEQALAGNPYTAGVESVVPLPDAVVHAIRRRQRPVAQMYSLGDPVEEWFPAPVMELLLLTVEDVSALVAGINMGLTREEIPALLSIQAR